MQASRRERYFAGRAPQVTAESSEEESDARASHGAQLRPDDDTATSKPVTQDPPRQSVTRPDRASEQGDSRRRRAAPVILDPGRNAVDSGEQRNQPPASARSATASAAKPTTSDNSVSSPSASGSQEDDSESSSEASSNDYAEDGYDAYYASANPAPLLGRRADTRTHSDDRSDTQTPSNHTVSEASRRVVFVPKQARASQKARREEETADAAENARQDAQRLRRVEETRALVADVLEREELATALGARTSGLAENGGSALEDLPDLPDDDDRSSDDDVQYALWKVRQMKRIQRDLTAEKVRSQAHLPGSPEASNVARSANEESIDESSDKRKSGLESSEQASSAKEKRGVFFRT